MNTAITRIPFDSENVLSSLLHYYHFPCDSIEDARLSYISAFPDDFIAAGNTNAWTEVAASRPIEGRREGQGTGEQDGLGLPVHSSRICTVSPISRGSP